MTSSAPAAYTVGVDLGGTNIKFAVIDADGGIVARQTVPTEGHEGHDAVLQRMTQGVKDIRRFLPEGAAVEAIGVGVPGLLDMPIGTTLDLPNLPGKWANVPVKQIMEAALSIPVHMINDVRAFTTAELQLGAARALPQFQF